MSKKISSMLLITLILISFSIIGVNSSVYGQKEKIDQYSYSTSADLPTIGGLYYPTLPLEGSSAETIEKHQESQQPVTVTSSQLQGSSPTTVSTQTVSTTGENPTTAPEQNRERIVIQEQPSNQGGLDIVTTEAADTTNEGVREIIVRTNENPDETALEGILNSRPTFEGPEATAQTPEASLNPIFRTCNTDQTQPEAALFATYEIEGNARIGKLFNDGDGQNQLQIKIFNDLTTHFLTGRILVDGAETQVIDDSRPEFSQVLENDKSERDKRVKFNIEDVDTQCENRVNPQQLSSITSPLGANEAVQTNPPIRMCAEQFSRATYTISGAKLSNGFDGEQDIVVRIFNDLTFGQLRGELLIDGNHRETFTPTIYTECQQDTEFNVP
jgi:hypothetical protein